MRQAHIACGEMLVCQPKPNGKKLPEVDFTVNCSKGFYVRTYAHDGLEIVCNKRLAVRAHALCAEAPALDVLLVPGGNGSRAAAEDPKLLDWVRSQAAGCRWPGRRSRRPPRGSLTVPRAMHTIA